MTDTSTLLVDKHVQYIQSLDKKQDSLEYWMSEHLRVSGIYWGLVALELMGRAPAFDKDAVVAYVLTCQNADGGFGGHTSHDSHLLYTMSAVQILAMYDALDQISADKVVQLRCWAAGQRDRGGERRQDGARRTPGSRSSRWQSSASSNAVDRIKVGPIVEYVSRSMNYDGGFGSGPGGESHAAQVFTSLACLAIAGRLDVVDRERTVKVAGRAPAEVWRAERPPAEARGRLLLVVGRCRRSRSWAGWTGSTRTGLPEFILSAQDPDNGGIADRPGDVADVYHTCFGIAGLSLIGFQGYGLEDVDPVYCMPVKVIERMGLRLHGGAACPSSGSNDAGSRSSDSARVINKKFRTEKARARGRKKRT
ncbi:terpenoid cyclases/Protein prenyltransferase [Linderina pennispora]|uniref:Geranylgeranyl transferase type II subunit beta n=1 Tax=Linderina pennispora TaxID=61395 RepID=A0A1Y1WDJ8_9FUNG|nr:terpenoid cyclases/Protein prenyltransferase [Linderina pennispora]ORX71601.1 terpenoid cyclases/Protein prenyltransferase [Linderina pennispora]